MPFSAPVGVQLYLYSQSDELITVLSDNNISGQLLDVELVYEKFGGLMTFSFNLSRDYNFPLTKNMTCFFYVSGILWSGGYLIEIPEADSDTPVLRIKGEGFFKRLKNKVINESYSAQTFEFIVDDILTSHLGSDIGIFYDALKIDVPTIASITIEFKDKTLLQVIKNIIQLCNKDYNNVKYIVYIDNDRELVIEELSEDFQQILFEGYNYQSPDSSKDFTKIVNSLDAYRSTLADPNVVEFVNNYDVQDSIDRNSLYQKKITFSDYTDTTTIANLSNAVLDRRAYPQDKVKIDNLEITNILNFGKYRLNNKRQDFWQLIADCDALTGWDFSNLSVTTAALSSTHVLTGKQSIKFVTGSGSDGEYAEYILSTVIPFPTLLRLYMYFESTTSLLTVTFFDEYNNEVVIDFETLEFDMEVTHETTGDDEFIVSSDPVTDQNLSVDIQIAVVDQWAKIEKELEAQVITSNYLELYDGVNPQENMELYDGSITEDAQALSLSGNALINVSRVRITFNTDSVTTVYLDRLEAKASIYKHHDLQLEKVLYTLSAVGLFANAEFGDKSFSIVDEIKDNVKNGDLALQVFSKQ